MNKNKISVYLLVLTLMGFLLSGCVVTPVEEEENPAATSTGLTLTVGTPVVGQSLPAYGTRSYNFTATVAGDYTVYTYNASVSNADASITKNSPGWGWCGSHTRCSIFDGLNPGQTASFDIEESFGMGFSYDIIVVAGEGNDGEINSPVTLTPGTSYLGTYGNKGYYQFTTGATAGATLITANSTTQDVSWKLYSTSDFSSTLVTSCNDTWWDIGEEACYTDALDANTTYYLEVSISFDGLWDNVSVLVGDAPLAGSSSTTPNQLTPGTQFSGTMINYTSFHSFTTSATAGSIDISATSVAENISWKLYSDADYTILVDTCADNSSTGTETCSTSSLDANTVYYLKVYCSYCADNDFSLSVGTTVTVIPGQSMNDPNPLSSNVLFNGVIGLNYSYHTFTTGATAGAISITASSAKDLQWNLFSDAGYSIQVGTTCDSSGSGTISSPAFDTCTTDALTANTTYYLGVRCWSLTSCSNIDFSVLVNSALGQDINNPNPLTIGAAAIDGLIDTNDSYHSFTPATTGAISITATAVKDMVWRLYSDAAYTTQVGTTCDNNSTGAETCTTSSLTAATPYYLKVSCWSIFSCTNIYYSVEIP